MPFVVLLLRRFLRGSFAVALAVQRHSGWKEGGHPKEVVSLLSLVAIVTTIAFPRLKPTHEEK